VPLALIARRSIRSWPKGFYNRLILSVAWDMKGIQALGEENRYEPPSRLAPCASREKEAKTILRLSFVA
jgi:hypothetical protein